MSSFMGTCRRDDGNWCVDSHFCTREGCYLESRDKLTSSVKMPPLIYVRGGGCAGGMELCVVEYKGDSKVERAWPIKPDAALFMARELLNRALWEKSAGTP